MATLSRKTLMCRGISFFVAIAFTMTTLCGSTSQAFASAGVSMTPARSRGFDAPFSQAGAYAPPSETGLRKDLYALPAGLGSLVTFWEPSAGTSSQDFVVHIQDAHANPEAQQNISKILKFLTKQYPDLVIGVEGAAGPLHPEYLQFFREFPEADQAVAEDLRQKGELSGAELYLLERDSATRNAQRTTQDGNEKSLSVERSTLSAPRAHGVEDAGLYLENLKTYRELLFSRDRIQAGLNPIRAKLEGEASRGLNADLRNFLKEKSRRKDGRYYPDRMGGDPDLQVYVQYLKKQTAKILQVDLQDPFEQLRFPNLVRIALAVEAGKGFDAAEAREDWANVLAAMKKSVKEDLELEFIHALESFGHEKGMVSKLPGKASVASGMEAALYPRKLLEQLFIFSQKHAFSLAGHESFLRSFELLILQAEVEAAGLLLEMNVLEAMLIEKLAKTDAEKELVRRLASFHLLEKLLYLELTREEHSQALAGRDRMTSFVKDSPELSGFLSRAFYFYETTLRRDQALVENALALAVGTGEKQKRIIVLITGGFHADGITDVLRERRIGYATLTPHISRTDHGELYQKVMSDSQADLSAYFKVKNPFSTKQEALLFKEMLEVATPVLFEKYKMEPSRMAEAVRRAVATHPVLSAAVEVQAAGEDTKTVRFTPRTMTSQNAAIPTPALMGGLFLKSETRRMPTASDITFGERLLVSTQRSGMRASSFGRRAEVSHPGRSEVREERQPLAKQIETILVVDDERIIAWGLATILNAFGFKAVSAYSDEEALEKLKEFKPDAILSDVRMPGMTGPEWALEAVKTQGLEQTPVVFMSAFIGDQQAALDQAMNELVTQGHPVHFFDKSNQLDVLEAVFTDPVNKFQHWPARSEVREEVERPLDMSPEESAQVKKIFVFGHKGPGEEKLGEDLILYSHFVPLLLKKFPKAQIHMAIDYQNIFSSERYRGRVFPVSDSLYSPVNGQGQGRSDEPMEPRDGMIPAIPVPAGAMKKVMTQSRGFEELGQWLMDEHYDLVFDFTVPHLSDYFSGVKDAAIPMVFSNMNIILKNAGIERKESSPNFEIQMLDSMGTRLVKGMGDIDEPTRDGKRPVFWEMVLRVYRALGLLSEHFDLQMMNGSLLPLHDEEKTWVASNLESLLVRNGMTPEMARDEILAGQRKFIYVNIFAQSNPNVFKEEQWVSLLKSIFIPDARGKRPMGDDVYLVFSSGGFKDYQDQKVLDSILGQLKRILGPAKSRFLLKVPENLSIGRVQEIMRAMDFVVTPDTGFSHLATALDIPQVEFLPFPQYGSRWKTYRKNSLVVDPLFLKFLAEYPDLGNEKILDFIAAHFAKNPVPRKNTALKISAAPSEPAPRSEMRTRKEEQTRAFDSLRSKLLKKDERFLNWVKQMKPSGIREGMAHTWKPKSYYLDFMSLFRTLETIRLKALKNDFVGPGDIRSLKKIVDGIFVRFEKEQYRGALADRRVLTPFKNSLKNWAMGWYKPTSFHRNSDVNNRSIRQYIRKEADAWLIGMMRFIEMTPEYQTGFLELVRTFPEAVWEWSREPWKTPGDRKKVIL